MSLEHHQHMFVAALRAGDESAARTIVEQVSAAGVAPAEIYFQIFAPSMVAIGELWERNELNVAEEHLATAITERLIGTLSPRFSDPPSRSPGAVVLGCVAGERHTLGLRMLADLFRLQGWRVLYLGADVPTHDWLAIAKRYQADAIAISVNMSQHLVSTRVLIAELRAAQPNLIVLVGGAAFALSDELWRQVGATLYHSDPFSAVDLATQHALGGASPPAGPGEDA